MKWFFYRLNIPRMSCENVPLLIGGGESLLRKAAYPSDSKMLHISTFWDVFLNQIEQFDTFSFQLRCHLIKAPL